MRVQKLTVAWTVLLHLLLAANHTAIAQTAGAETQGQTYAIIIGISNYKFIRPLTYADKDAELFRDFLKSAGGGKLDSNNIFCLLNDEAKAANFWIKGMNWLRSKALKKGDRLYLYLAGHGDAINQDEYFFLTYDCNPAGDKNNYIVTGNIQLYNLKTRITEYVSKGVEVFLIMDACRSNELPGGAEGQQLLNSAISEKKSGEVIMLATGAGQESYEDGSIGSGHGLFTYYLVDGLIGYADLEGNKDKKIAVKEIQDYVNTHVPTVAKERYKKAQNPFFYAADETRHMAHVDSSFFNKWGLVKGLKNLTGSEMDAMNRSVAARAGEGIVSDSNLIKTYVQFLKALKEANLTGAAHSAEHYYNLLQQQWPQHPIVKDARLALAAEFVNFAQTKINLYLHGRDEVSVQQLRMQMDDGEGSDETLNTLDRMEKIARQNFSLTGRMLDLAASYLDAADSTIIKQIMGKTYFFKAHGYFDKGNRTLNYTEALRYARMAAAVEPGAAYVMNTLASLHLQSKKFDSALYYAGKAALLAPLWQLPYLNKAYVYKKMNLKDSTLYYFQKAAQTNTANADTYVDLGRHHHSLRNADSAQFYYQKALTTDRKNVAAHNNMGWLLKEQKDYEGAIQHFRASLADDSRLFNAYHGLSKVYTEMRVYDSARWYYQRALEETPDKTITTNHLGNFHKGLRQYDSALHYYRMAVAYDPFDNTPHLNIGSMYAEMQQFDSAIHYYNQAAVTSPADDKVANELGTLYRQRKQYDSSIHYFSKAYQQNSFNSRALNNLGQTYLEERKYDSAVHYYTQALLLEPDNAALYNNMGVAYKEMNNRLQAKSFFEKAINANPAQLSAYSNLGWLYREERKFDSAKIYFKKAVFQNPGNRDALNNLMNLFKYVSQYDSVKYFYNALIKADPKNVALNNNFGVFYFDIRGYDSAILLYRKTITLDPRYAIGYNNLGTVYNELSMFDSALHFYRQAVVLDPLYTHAWFNMGMSLYNKSQYDSAINRFAKAVQLNPANNYYDYFTACAYAQKKNPALCMQHLQTALEKGYADYWSLLRDADLNTVRNTTEFKELVKKWVPQKHIDMWKTEEGKTLPAPTQKEDKKQKRKG